MSNKKAIFSLALCAIVVCMAVVYAAFSTTLTVNGTGTITSTWDVKFDTSVTSGTATGTATCGTVTYSGLNATVSASLVKPTDKCVYNLKIINNGSLNASLATPTITAVSGCTVSGSACTSSSGNIKITKGSLSASTLAAKNGSTVASATLPVTIEFVDKTVTSLTSSESATAKISVVATQATS